MKKTSSSFKKKRLWTENRFPTLLTDLSYSWDSVLGKDFYILMDSVTAVEMKNTKISQTLFGTLLSGNQKDVMEVKRS